MPVANRGPRPARGVPPRRGRVTSPVLVQLNPPYPFRVVRAPGLPRGVWPRRGRAAVPPPPQVSVWQPARRARVLVPARRHVPPVPLAAQDVPVPPPRRGRAAVARRGRVVVPQPPAAPAYPGAPARARARGPRLGRGRVVQLVPPQAQDAPPPGRPQRRGRLVPRARPLAQPVPAAPAAPAPAWVSPHRAPVRALALIRRRFAQLLPWPQATTAPPPFTVGALSAADKPGGVLTAAGGASALTASTAPAGTLTASDQRTGGPGG